MKKSLYLSLVIILIMTVTLAYPVAAALDFPHIIDKIMSFNILDADILVTATPFYHGSPLHFTAYSISDTEVSLEWKNPPESINTMIRVAYGSYPTTITDGYLVYLGTEESANDQSIDLDSSGCAYYSAFAEYPEGYAPEHSSGYVEGSGMLAIADALDMLSKIGISVLYLIIAAALAIWADKKNSGFMYLIATAALGFAALFWIISFRDIYGLAFSILIAAGSTYCGYEAWEYYAKRRGKGL